MGKAAFPKKVLSVCPLCHSSFAPRTLSPAAVVVNQGLTGKKNSKGMIFLPFALVCWLVGLPSTLVVVVVVVAACFLGGWSCLEEGSEVNAIMKIAKIITFG